MMKQLVRVCLWIFFACQVYCGRVQHISQTRYIVAGETVELGCSPPSQNELLIWKFQANGSDVVLDAAQHYPGGIVSIFRQFDLPPGRSTLIAGSLEITKVGVKDEGHYWCEITARGQSVVLSDKIPLHVWVTPQSPQLQPIGNGTVLEYTPTTVARCRSTGGKPASTLSWWNGTSPLVSSAFPVISKNAFSDDLWDSSLDLILEDPTRFDFLRDFTCRIEHPAYRGNVKTLNHSVKVLYHPVNPVIWANLSSLIVYCEADSYPASTYSWDIPGRLVEDDSPYLLIPNLYSMPGNQFFECTADNGIPDPATVRVSVEELRYPNGRPIPQWLGLEWYIWAGIGGAVLALIVIIIVGVCCYCKKKKKKGNSRDTKSSTRYSKPLVDVSGTRNSQHSLLELDSIRTPDGRESSRAPSEVNYSKASMAKSYSLEHLVEEKYAGRDGNNVTLVPLDRHSRGNMYADSSLNRRASREEIDKVADHIEVLNKSWDNLARSREELNRSREELRVDLPPRYQSHDDLRQPDESSRDNYPYMDDTADSRRNRYSDYPRSTNSYSNRNYYEHDIVNRPRHDDPNYYHGNQGASNDYYDDQQYNSNYGYGASSEQYDDRGYNQYDDGQYRQDQNYGQSQYNHDNQRNESYGDSEFDDDNRNYDYDARGYQPASMI